MSATVVAVHRSSTHSFSKHAEPSIHLIEGIGVEGDAHSGTTVKHRSRVKQDPSQPNLRQVHLIHAELHDQLNAGGYRVSPGDMGENITTRGLDLLTLPTGARLEIGSAVIEVTGLRNPCYQLDKFEQGLMQACLANAEDGTLLRLAGVMGVVIASGDVRPGDEIRVLLPVGAHTPLQPV
ncbi:MAG: MOSC domain-containing protein [Dehalococcoidia bacterium]